jgi:SAM-dependent methyltransferase
MIMRAPDTTEYHLAELKIAQDPHARGHILPTVPEGCQAVLDIGCGAGQSLIAMRLEPHQLACGVDPNESALELGRKLTDRVRFAAATGEALPYAAETFDLVFSRVALPYTNIPRALAEIARVLRPGGTVWLTLHGSDFLVRGIGSALRGRSPGGLLYSAFILSNALLLHFVGRQFAWPFGNRRYESVQTSGGITRALRRAGLRDARIDRREFFVVTARKAVD